jgi:hypothetical protein
MSRHASCTGDELELDAVPDAKARLVRKDLGPESRDDGQAVRRGRTRQVHRDPRQPAGHHLPDVQSECGDPAGDEEDEQDRVEP